MAGKGFRLRWQPTSVGGSVSTSMTSWTQVVNGSVKLNQVIVKASRPDTIFDFKITSPTGNNSLYRKNIDNELNEKPDVIMRGLYSLTIENVKNGEGATIDDYFEGEFLFEDKKDK